MRFKRELNMADLPNLNPYLKVVMAFFEAYCIQHDLPCLVTSMMSDRVEGRVSDTHKEGRAVDFSCRGFNEFHIARIKHYLNKKFGVEWGTRPVNSHVVPRVCVVHGDDLHFHIQVRRGIFFSDLD